MPMMARSMLRADGKNGKGKLFYIRSMGESESMEEEADPAEGSPVEPSVLAYADSIHETAV